ncbi:endonuclease NucS [Haloarchaeobius salinus]|uniref:endonuclease NucS n=1 Tax=Haloarchaeobius salinus TaxID=1198298 RepID=UPI00210ED93A
MTTERTGTGVRTVVEPTLSEAEAAMAGALERGDLLTVFGRCSVDYEGRASSTLGPGDRHVTAKPDGTVLVHTDEGQQPVNWQPPGCSQRVERVEGGDEGTDADDDAPLRLVSTRESPDEELVVSFESVRQVSAFAVDDGESLSLTGSEEDLRQRVLESPDLVEPGFQPLVTERRTAAGAVDIFGEDADGNVVVVELKRKRVGPDAVGQLTRYVDALERDLHADATVRGILVAPSVTDRARRMLADRGLEFSAVEPPSEGE